MKPAISQVCTLNSTFAKDIKDFSAAHCEHVELWLTKLETYLAAHSHEEFRELLQSHNIRGDVASFQGGLLISQGPARREAWDLLARRLLLCSKLDVGTLVVVGDIVGSLTQQDLDRVRVSLVDLAKQAEQHRVRIALEFQSNASFANNLQTAVALVADIGHPALGLCLDAFHYYVGPSKPDDLELLTNENLFHVQLCDIADVPRELASDADRILPGDGDIPLQPIVKKLRDLNYDGQVSLELMNPQMWQVPALQLGEIGVTALRKLLGQASC